MLSRKIFALSLLTLSTTALADSVDLNLRNSSAQLRYSAAMANDALGKSELFLGALYANPDHANNTLIDFGMMVKDQVGDSVPGMSVGVGIKGLAAHTQGTNESGVAIGGMLRYSPPALPKMGLTGQVYLAPNITTFGSAEKYTEADARLEYDVIPTAAAYIGYRKIQFGLNNGGNALVDEGAFIGVRMSF
jgi:hypothetical protein